MAVERSFREVRDDVGRGRSGHHRVERVMPPKLMVLNGQLKLLDNASRLQASATRQFP